MAGKTLAAPKKEKAAPKKTPENQEVIQGEPTVTKAEKRKSKAAAKPATVADVAKNGNPEQTVFKLQNSGILCIDRVPEIENPVIRWALMPAIG